MNYPIHRLTLKNYSPFGTVLYGRSWSGEEYRYGFQNQEEDEELWEGAVNYKYRIEDPRLGRFFSVDPLFHKYHHNSNYAFSENHLIHGVELEGCEVTYEKTIEKVNDMETTIIKVVVYVTVSSLDTKMNNNLPTDDQNNKANAGFKAIENSMSRQIGDVKYHLEIIQVEENEVRAAGKRVNLIFDNNMPNKQFGYTRINYEDMKNKSDGKIEISPLLRFSLSRYAISHEIGHFLGLMHIPKLLSRLNLMRKQPELNMPDKDEFATGQDANNIYLSDRQVKRAFRKIGREFKRNEKRMAKELKRNRGRF